jgi:tRNA(Ile)-lysidine synthase
MLEQVRLYAQRHCMLAAGDRVVVAVSGGPDSVALLHMLHRLAPEWRLQLHVFHMDHGLRGEESRGDALYVQSLAERLELPCTVVTLETGALKAQSGSLQANARAFRYREMESLAIRISANRIALGHSRDDQAETVLMRLLRGSGTKGLAGIPPVRAQGTVTYIRPLLATPRNEIDKYCREAELSPHLDKSNLKTDYLRNRIRLQLIPHLAEEFNPAIAANLAQTAEVLREEEYLLEEMAACALERCRAPGQGVALVGTALRGEPIALARRVVRLAAREVAGPEFDLGLEAVSQVIELAASSHGTRWLYLPGGFRVAAEYGVCRLFQPHALTGEVPGGEWAVAPAGQTIVPELGISLEATAGRMAAGPDEAAFDADRIPGPLSLRLRRPGDRLWPVGMTGSKKLQDILVDTKVPRRLRDQVPLLVSGDEVLWVIGHRLDRRFLAGEATRHVLNIRVSALDSRG